MESQETGRLVTIPAIIRPQDRGFYLISVACYAPALLIMAKGRSPRKYALSLVDDGLISADDLLIACLKIREDLAPPCIESLEDGLITVEELLKICIAYPDSNDFQEILDMIKLSPRHREKGAAAEEDVNGVPAWLVGCEDTLAYDVFLMVKMVKTMR